MFSSDRDKEWCHAMTYYYDTFGKVKKEQVEYGIYSAAGNIECGTQPRYNVYVRMIQRVGEYTWKSHALESEDADKLVNFFITLQ